MKRSLIIGTALFIVCFFVFSSNLPVSAKEIKIGFIGILSGPGASAGKPFEDGAKLAVKECNEKGGLLGRKLKLVSRDSKGRPGEAVRVAREIILKDRVSYIVGPFTDAESMAVSQVSRELKTIIMPYTARTMNLLAPENFHPYVFQPSANAKYDGAVIAQFIFDHPEWKTVFIISPDYEYGHLQTRYFKAALAAKPEIKVVGEAWPKLFETDYGPYITQILEKKPDVLHVIQWGGDAMTLLKQCKTYGAFEVIKQVTSVGESGTPEICIPMGDDFPEGVYANSMEVFYYPDTPEHNAYVKAMRELTGEEYIAGAACQGYIATNFLIAATAKAGSTKSMDVVKALEGLTIDTPIGKQTMGKDHQERRGWFWGLTKKTPKYPFVILDPVEYIPFEDSMVR